ncbi:MAG: beta-N-acetylhexosaminidase [Pikeienuella sp.]
MADRSAAIYGFSGFELTAEECAFFREANPWGFILFRRNVDNPAQVLALTDQLRDVVGWDVPVLVDQEGGRVQRLRPPHWRSYTPALTDARRPDAAKVLALRCQLIADELREVGIDVNCAPLLDVATDTMHDVIGDRALGSDPAVVAELGHAVLNGLAAGGVSGVIKHLPGHGRALVDPHHDLPVVKADRATLEADFAPFRAHKGAAIGMTGHQIVEAVDADNVTTFSRECIDLIRDDIGFDGVLMTDDLSMGALSGTYESRVERALGAGCDLILHCNGDMAEMQAIANTNVTLAGDAKRRADAAIAARPDRPTDFDAEAAFAEYQALTQATTENLAEEPAHA